MSAFSEGGMQVMREAEAVSYLQSESERAAVPTP
jgi:hypothetical protein